MMNRRVLLVAALAGLGHFTFIQAQEHWVATWTTAETLAHTPAPAAAQAPAGPATPQSIARSGFHNQTVRMVVRTSIPGKRVRITLSNAFGSQPVEIGAAHIAVQEKGSAIASGTDRALTFGGQPGCTIRPGAVELSDPVDMNVPQTAHLAVSLFFPGETGVPTVHSTALHDTYVSEGDATGQASISEPVVTHSYYYLDNVDVIAPANAALIVTFGDSITDGARSENETDHSWPALLAERLAKNKSTAHIAVGNMGIGGNRVLRDGTGISALARLDRDVISQPGVKWLMVLEGINDIGHGATDPTQPVTAEELIAAHKQIIDRAHMHGIKVIGCTLTPYDGAGYMRESGEQIREAVNNWIRTSGAYDAVVDFEAAVRDPQNPKRFRPDFDPGDHLHPNNAGYEAMANAVDLKIFTKK